MASPTLTAPSPRLYPIPPRSRVSAAISPAASTPRDIVPTTDNLQRAIRRLIDPNSPLYLEKFRRDWNAFQTSIGTAFLDEGNGECSKNFDYEGTLRSLLATAEAIEQHLRLTGLGAIPLLNAHTSEPIDIQQLINARSKDAQIGFDQKQRAKEASDAISRRP